MASFRCESCGHQSPKWMGFCPQCGTGEPLVEVGEPISKRAAPSRSVSVTEATEMEAERISTGWLEVDRVLAPY